MTHDQYLAALKRLGLPPHGKATEEALGRSLRQCQRYAAGAAPIPRPVAMLLAAMLEREKNREKN